MSFTRTPPPFGNGDDPFAIHSTASGSGSAGKGKAKQVGGDLDNATPVHSARKRNGQEAGLSEDSPFHPLRRSLMQSQVTTSSLERKLSVLQRGREEDERTIAEQKAQIDKLMSDRRLLDSQREDAVRRAESLEDEVATLKQSQSQSLIDASKSSSQLQHELESLRTEYRTLSSTHVTLATTLTTTKTTLESRISNLEREKAELLPYRESAHDAQRDVDRLMRELVEMKQTIRKQSIASPRPTMTAPGTPAEDLRSELRRQASQLTSLQASNNKLHQENQELRARRDNVEMIKSELKNVERKSKEKIRSLMEDLDRARREMDSLTQAFAPPADSSDTTTSADLISLQHRLSTLAAAHANCDSSITAHKNQIGKLLEQIQDLSDSSGGEIIRLERKLEEAEREWRWAKEGREKAESKLGLARQEIEGLRMKLTAAGQGTSSADTEELSIQIAQLEDTIEMYKEALEKFENDSREVQAKVILDLDLVKRSDLDEALRKGQSLETIIQDLKDHITQLEKQNVDLDREVGDLMIRVGSGEYNTKVWRCVELGGGPAAKDWAIRTETLETLRKENVALLAQVHELEGKVGSGDAVAASGGSGFVPRETYDRLVKESDAKIAAAELRLQRLKEAYGAMSKEFLEAVYCLLGWRIKFDEKGVLLTPMYARKGLKLRFTSNEGHWGTMSMTGRLAKGLEDVKQYWVVDRNSIPGFLSQVTLEIFEKTTIGRTAGWKENDEEGEDE